MKIEFEPTGIISRTDELGRVAIPLRLREICKIKTGEEFEFFADKNGNFYLKRGKK